MTTPINLNKVRKEQARSARKTRAEENTVRFGRTKTDKEADKAHNDKSERFLDGHKRDP